MTLMAVIGAFEENKCFFVEEAWDNPLLHRNDASQQLQSFVGRYFEPIGLPKNDPIVVNARSEGRIQVINWRDFWGTPDKRALHERIRNITSLRRTHGKYYLEEEYAPTYMWRLLPQVRNDSCTSIEWHSLDNDEYLVFSVRRGEALEFTKTQDYIDAVEEACAKHYGGKMPKIFVATDDCAVMGELREKRPDWVFTSECDRSNGHNQGFMLTDMRQWTLEETGSLVVSCLLFGFQSPISFIACNI